MQDASKSLEQALEEGEVTWVPNLAADWEIDGFNTGGSGAVDDLSQQMGAATVAHSMDDGLPDEVSFMSGGVPVLKAGLGGKDNLNTVQYWSPFRTDSPVYGFDRDVAPTRLDLGVVTSAGVEETRLFTGVMRDIPVSGGRASLQAASQTRVDLSKIVQPPLFARRDSGTDAGLTATHPITWALLQAGVYCAPPPQDGTLCYLPLHGSGQTQIPSQNLTLLQNTDGMVHGIRRISLSTGYEFPSPKWIRGPYVGASYGQIKTDQLRGVTGGSFDFSPSATQPLKLDDPNIWTQIAHAVGGATRLEFWVRGDAFDDINTTPGGSGVFVDVHPAVYPGTTAMVCGFSLRYDTSVSAVAMGIDGSRNMYISCWDNTGTNHKRTGSAIPTDGEWHFVGFAISSTSNKVWFNLDGVVTTNTISPSINSANLPLAGGATTLAFNFFLPTAEVHLTGMQSGGSVPATIANPDTGNPWVNAQTWTQRAFVYPSALQLETMTDTVASEVWQFIASYAKAEYAQMVIDEHDLFHYWPRGYPATVAGQAIAEVLSSAVDSNVPEVIHDHTRIRTACRITYQDTRVAEIANTEVVSLRTVLTFPPGVTVFQVAFEHTAGRVIGGVLELLTAAQVAGGAVNSSYISLNSDSNALGIYATLAEVTPTVVDAWAGGAIIEIFNTSGTTWYMVNDGDTYAFLGIWGRIVTSNSISLTEVYDAGVEIRGERALTLNVPRIQSEDMARKFARGIVIPGSFPTPIIPQVQLFGNPLRQVGDVIQYEDDAETGADGLWRVHSIGHDINGASYTQTVAAKRDKRVGVWGQSQWGRCVWTGQEVP